MTRPFANYRFFVSLDPSDGYLLPLNGELMSTVGAGAFSDVTGLSGELEVLGHPEGGQNTFVHQLPVRYTWGRITLKKGVLLTSRLYEWFAAGLEGSLGARRDGAVVLLSADGVPITAWEWTAGLAVKWTGPDLNARDAGVAIESLEIVHQGIRQLSLTTLINAGIGALS